MDFIIYWGLNLITISLLITGWTLLIDRTNRWFDWIPEKGLKEQIFMVCFLLSCLIAVPSSYYILGLFGLYPRTANYTIIGKVEKTQKQIEELATKSNQLKKLLVAPEDLTIAQIENILSETLEFTTQLRRCPYRSWRFVGYSIGS